MKKITLLFWMLCIAMVSSAQILEPIKWEVRLNDLSANQKELVFRAMIDAGWHLYGTNLPEGGPISTSFTVTQINGGEVAEEVKANVEPIEKHDALFDMRLTYFEKEVIFTLPINVTDAASFGVSGEVEFMACDDQNCLPPSTVEFSFGKVTAETTETATTSLSTLQSGVASNPLWTPVINDLHTFGERPVTTDSSWWIIFLAGFLGGVVALMTPCVWPMIPMTVSFFLKRTKNRRKAITDAITYGVSIIVIYLILGLLITAIFGASALNDLSTNAIFNLIFFALLVLFAISFFGAFELVLPTSWTNKLDAKADSTSGLLSIFFMAFTLSLVSFSCTGPIIGTLLVQAASMGSMTGPAIGMFGFALALAIPFALFAIFPSWLQGMPKSGGWLNSVKVILGFLELALALKFLSVADLAYGWRILDREVFLVLWIVIFALMGLYLLGKLKFSHDSDLPYVSIPRFFMATISFAFALYMVPGLWGAPLKAISAFAPPLTTQDFNLYQNEVHASFDDYDAGMAYAKSQGKPVLVDFSGYGCVNCRKMEATVWTDSKVKQVLDNQFVLITLYVDNKTSLPEPIEIEEHGRTRRLRTYGDKWSYLQRHKFGANAQPFYVILNNEGKPLAPSYSFDESVDNFLNFLQKGIDAYK